MSGDRARVRGIYATALTRVLADAGFEVVQASPPIRRRFDAEFDVAEHDVRVRTTGDRQGVELSGVPDAVEEGRETVTGLARDAFAWPDETPRAAVFDGRVERTGRGGAVVALGDGLEGYLPFGNAEDHVSEGDSLRVQVREPAAPWSDDRPLLGTTVRTPGEVAALVRGVDALVAGTPDGTAEHELARVTEMLSTTVPDGWGVDWGYAAEDAGLDALDDALAAAADRAADLEAALADSDRGDGSPGLIAVPRETVWAWFGRETRFACDDRRRDVTATMAGHHRVKAGSDAASDAVDFVERLGLDVEAFPFAAVVDQFGPATGDRVAIEHGKPDGRLITLGRGEVTEIDAGSATLAVRRELTGGGTYDALGVPREEGDVAVTKFREGRWWYPTVYRSTDGDVKGTYVNVSTPVELFPDAVRYVDLHVDVVKHADGDVEVVDEDELRESVETGHVSEELAEQALDVAERVARGVGG